MKPNRPRFTDDYEKIWSNAYTDAIDNNLNSMEAEEFAYEQAETWLEHQREKHDKKLFAELDMEAKCRAIGATMSRDCHKMTVAP